MKEWMTLAVVAMIGCGHPLVAPPLSPEHARALDAANRLERSDHHGDASRAYDKAASLATRPRSRNFALYRAAREAEMAGERRRALEAYLRLVELDPGGEYAARSLYYAARLTRDAGDLDGAIALLRRVIREYHEDGIAPQAVRRAVQWLRSERGDEAALHFLRTEEQVVSGTDVADTILYHMGTIERDRGRWEAALRIFERIDELYPWPRSTIWDNALYEAGRIADEHGQPRRAIGYLRKVASWQEASIPTGSYFTELTDDAQLLIGRIYLEKLREPIEAARAFEELADFPDSTLADDGLLWAARARLAADDRRRACRNLRRLLRDFPYSNKQRQARRLFVETRCPR